MSPHSEYLFATPRPSAPPVPVPQQYAPSAPSAPQQYAPSAPFVSVPQYAPSSPPRPSMLWFLFLSLLLLLPFLNPHPRWNCTNTTITTTASLLAGMG